MELNREQIIKAWEHCSNGGNCNKCSEDAKNPRLSREGCMALQMRNALSLINELTAENERLRADKDYWKSRAKESDSEYDQAVKRGYNLGAIDYVCSFAERLKAETITIQGHTGKLGSVVFVETIDQIEKEMLDES